MIKTLIEGFTLGFSTGSICLVSCTPIYLPYLVSEKRSFAKNLFKVLEISLGRFFSYIVFGLMAGWIGSNIATINRDLFTGIAYVLLSSFLVLSVVRTKKKGKGCKIPKFMNITSSAFLLGVFTGINFCPSFLIALSKAVDLAGPISGALLFIGFFFGTSIFLAPLAFSGFLAQIKKLKIVAQFASIGIAAWFLYTGSMKFYEYYQHTQAIYLDPTEESYPVVLQAHDSNTTYFNVVADSLFSMKRDKFTYVTVSKLREGDLMVENKNTIFIIDSTLIDSTANTYLNKYHHYSLEKDYPIGAMMNFLKNSVMKLQPKKHIDFSFTEKEHKH
ncbi:MAG: hypothetical protein B6226_02505 [Candidatus Cloacimonetes bacterium 4572_65]|nr:MAG: hypothetical protein B6226_02505 [Candidatus Cloacimonetes bacterium 4572_65]